MQDFSKEKIESLVAGWKNHNKNQYWVKKHAAVSKYLGGIKRCLASFDETEEEFLQTLYINLSDGNLRSSKILSLGEKFAHAEYFFMDQFFDSNISAFYYDFVFKDRIVGKKDLFPKNAVKSVASVLSGEDKDIVSLYVFIENIVKNFNSYSQERTRRDIFKQKLVNFYDELYRLFVAVDSALAVDFFDIALHNQPFILMEFLKSAINADNFYLIDSYLSDDGTLNLGVALSGDFTQISREKLYLLASVFTQSNDEFPTLLYSVDTVQILSLLYDEKVDIFAEFYEVSSRFIAEFTPYPADAVGAAKIVYSSLFFEYVKNYKSEEVAKNTIFYGAIGTGKTRRLRSLITEKKLAAKNFRYVCLHEDFEYRDFIDGFYGEKFLNGEFKALCKEALGDLKNEYYFLIDNANAASLDKILGEAAALLDRRYDENDEFSLIRTKNSHVIDDFEESERARASVVLKDGRSYFAVPKNLYVLCALSGDRGISPSVAKAFRWIKCECDYGALEDYLSDREIVNASAAVAVCKALNRFIVEEASAFGEIGHGVFMGLARYQNNAQITQESLNGFFAEVLEPIFRCGYANGSTDFAISKGLAEIKDIFKF